MMHVLLDTSVLIKWFHSEGEGDVGPARALRSAHVEGSIEAHILDLGVYEFANVLIRALRWPGSQVADQLQDMLAILPPPLSMSTEALIDAAHLADSHALSFYDASWAACARHLGLTLVSADARLVSTDLALTPSQLKELLLP